MNSVWVWSALFDDDDDDEHVEVVAVLAVAVEEEEHEFRATSMHEPIRNRCGDWLTLAKLMSKFSLRNESSSRNEGRAALRLLILTILDDLIEDEASGEKNGMEVSEAEASCFLAIFTVFSGGFSPTSISSLSTRTGLARVLSLIWKSSSRMTPPPMLSTRNTWLTWKLLLGSSSRPYLAIEYVCPFFLNTFFAHLLLKHTNQRETVRKISNHT